MIPTYTPKELENFELSPRDNLADYDPVEYIAMVKASVDAGKLENYTLSELQKLEDKVKIAYASLSNEEMGRHEDIFHQTFESIIDLQNWKDVEEAEAHIFDVHQGLAAGKFDNYSFTSHYEIKAGLDRAFGVLSTEYPAKVIVQAKSQLYSGLDAVYNKGTSGRALNYVNAISKLAADGSLDSYAYSELEKVEDRLSRAYSALSAEEQERVKEKYTQTITGLTNLQNNTVDGKLHTSLNSLLGNYVLQHSFNPQSWAGFKSGMYKQSPVVEEKAVSEKEKDVVEYSLVYVMPVPTHEQREPMISPVPPKKVYDEEFSLNALLGKTFVSPMGSSSFKASCVVEPKEKKEADYEPSEEAESFSFGNLGGMVGLYELSQMYSVSLEGVCNYVNKVEEPVSEPAPLALVETVVTPLPAKKKSGLVGYLAKTALVAAVGLASLVGYNHLTSSVPVTGTAMQNYRETHLLVEVIAPVSEAKQAGSYAGLSSEAESVDNQSRPVEQSTLAPQAAPRKVIKRFPPSYDPYDDSFHTVEKGDTVGGLYEDYAARGGTLSRSDYFKAIRMTNPHLENLGTIYVGQEIKVPQ